MDIDAIRKDFPVTKEFTYLDNAGLSPIPEPVVKAVEGMLHERSKMGVKAWMGWMEKIDEVKRLLAGMINATPEEIALTQNTSEGINMVANMLDWHPGDNVVINNLEFFPNYWPWLRLRKYGVDVRIVQHKNGYITTQDIAQQTDDRTRVIALSNVAWINGLKYDLIEIGKVAKQHGAYLVVDAIQSVGNMELDVRQGPVDFLACGGHKWLFSLLGTGFFFCRKELIDQFEPVYVGWQSSDARLDYTFREYTLSPTAHRFMSGNTSIAGVFALIAGINYINQIGLKNIENRNQELTNHLVEQLQAMGIGFLSPLEERYRSSIVNFLPADPQAVYATAEQRGIVVCVRGGGVRVSPNFYNTEEEIDRLVAVVQSVENQVAVPDIVVSPK
jgi:cysteine desulfurase/selenocysteine lyase